LEYINSKCAEIAEVGTTILVALASDGNGWAQFNLGLLLYRKDKCGADKQLLIDL
jgi:hypothetical protein